MSRVLIMCNSDPGKDPRPNRMIHWLSESHQVIVIARSRIEQSNVQSASFFDSMIASNIKSFQQEPARRSMARSKWTARKASIEKAVERLILGLLMLRRQYERAIARSIPIKTSLLEQLCNIDFDLIISHDCTLLPLATRIKGASNAKIMLDAREYYPLNLSDQLLWRLLFKPTNEYICSRYLSECSKILTVSDGLAERYASEYAIDPEVFMSLPTRHNLSPSSTSEERVRMIYHGHARESRKTEVMIDVMDHIDERIHLDLMLMPTSTAYFKKIKEMVNKRTNVRIIPPVPMQEIIPFTNQYDIGIFLCPPTNFNLEHALPNKFFEFIQARLLVAIGPSVEMARIIEKYNCGIISEDFSPEAMAQRLNELDARSIDHYKSQSHRAAEQLNADVNRVRIMTIVNELMTR